MTAGRAPLSPSQEFLRLWSGRVSPWFACGPPRRAALLMGEHLTVGMTSQRWRGVDWVHQLHLFRPASQSPRQTQALLFLSGGAHGAGATHGDEAARFRGELTLFAGMAQDTGSIVAVLSHTLCQPMFGGLGENDLLAHGFDRFLATGRRDWPVLAPMVAAVRRAMDAIQALAPQAWGARVDRFTLAGFSKRGWAAWLTAAVDHRVNAIAPIMMDFIDLPRQIAHQQAVWGGLPHGLRCFAERTIPARLDTPRGRQLLDMIDPITWSGAWPGLDAVARVIVSASNDEYWPADAANLYADRISGDSRRALIANGRHGSLAYLEIVGVVAALHRQVALAEPLPRLTARVWPDGDAIRLAMASDVAPTGLRLWRADAPGSDFRQSVWTATPLGAEATAVIERPAHGMAQLFGQAEYHGGSGAFSLTTKVWTIDSMGLW